MSGEKEQLAQRRIIQKKQEQAEPGSQKDVGGGGGLSAGDVRALQGMVGNTAVGQLGQVQRAPENGNGHGQLENASQAAFKNIVQRTPSNGAPLIIQRKLAGSSAALEKLGEGNIQFGGLYKSSWAKLLASVKKYEEKEATTLAKAEPKKKDQRKLLELLQAVHTLTIDWVTDPANQEQVEEIRNRRLVNEPTEKQIGNKTVAIPSIGYNPRADNPDVGSYAQEDEINHQKMSAAKSLLVRVNWEMKLLSEDFEGWHRSGAKADSQMGVSDWNEDYGAGGQMASLDKTAYAGGPKGFYQPDTDYNNSDTAGKLGIPKYDPNFSGRALAMARIDQLLSTTMLKQQQQLAKRGGTRMGASPFAPAGGSSRRAAPPLPEQQNMLVKTEPASHTRAGGPSILHGGGDTTGVFLEAAKGKEMRGGYIDQGDFVMSEAQREAGDNQKLNLNDPRFQRSLNKLQLLDAICGQIDRHAANFFVQLNGLGQVSSVEGIDNDMAFGALLTDPVTQRTNINGPGGDQRGDLTRNAWKSLPPIADKAMAQAIMALSSNDIIQAIEGLLEPAEVDATIQRLLSTQMYLQQLDKADLLNPDEWDQPAKLAKQTPANSYGGHLQAEAAERISGGANRRINSLVEQEFNDVIKVSQAAGFGLAFTNVLPEKIIQQVISPAAIQDLPTLRLMVKKAVESVQGAIQEDDTMRKVSALVTAVITQNDFYAEFA